MGAHFLTFVPQLHERDCVVSVLAMLLDVSYEEALRAFRHNVAVRGATTSQIRRAAKRLGAHLRLCRHVDLDEDFGILSLASELWKDDHVVVLRKGTIIDTDGTLWEADVYLATYSAKVLSLLSRLEE